MRALLGISMVAAWEASLTAHEDLRYGFTQVYVMLHNASDENRRTPRERYLYMCDADIEIDSLLHARRYYYND